MEVESFYKCLLQLFLVLCLNKLNSCVNIRKFCLVSYRTFCQVVPRDFGLQESIRTRLSVCSTSHLHQSQGLHPNRKWAQEPGFKLAFQMMPMNSMLNAWHCGQLLSVTSQQFAFEKHMADQTQMNTFPISKHI